MSAEAKVTDQMPDSASAAERRRRVRGTGEGGGEGRWVGEVMAIGS
jgi:hypothetical protein